MYTTLVVEFFVTVQRASSRVLGWDHAVGLLQSKVSEVELAAATAAVAVVDKYCASIEAVHPLSLLWVLIKSGAPGKMSKRGFPHVMHVRNDNRDDLCNIR